MKHLLTALTIMSISGCSDIYQELEVTYADKEIPTEMEVLDTNTFSVSSKNLRGIETYRGIATISISSKGFVIDAGAPFTDRVFIPIEDIAGCAMTCFGTDDQHIDFLIPRTGTDLSMQSSKVLLDWCWENGKPMYSGKVKRGWLYDQEPLPSLTEFEEQFASREVFDDQQWQSCLGY